MRGASCSLSHGRVELLCSEACCAAPRCFEACCAAPLTWLLPDGDSDTLRISLMMLTHDARGCCRGHCGCRLCSTAGVCRSKEFWQQAVGTCGLSCHLHRFIDFLAESRSKLATRTSGGPCSMMLRICFVKSTDLRVASERGRESMT